MISACILVRSEKGRFEEVVRKLKGVPWVRSVFPVLGRFDIVVDVEAPTGRDIARASTKANRMAGVVFTETLPEVIEE